MQTTLPKDSELKSYELKSGDEEVSFALRTTGDVMAMFGQYTDKPHRHNYYTVLWSHNSSGKHIIDYKEYEMEENDIFFVNPGQVHQVIHNETPDGTVILFSCDFLSKNYISENFISNLNLFSEITDSKPIKIDKPAAKILREITGKIREILANNDSFKYDIAGAYLKLFLIECNKFAHTSLSQNTQAIQSSRVIMQKFKELLEKNFTNWKKVSDYADQLNITADYLNNVAKVNVGKTAKELIQQRIIIESKRLGLHTSMTTKEIAFKLGFTDPSHFSRFFKNFDGNSFSDFRVSLNTDLKK